MTAPTDAQVAEIADRCERATGADRELDEAIQVALAGATAEWQEYLGRNAYHRDNRWVYIGEIKPYTASLDAATSLAPAECMYRSGHDGTGPDPSLFFCEAVTAAPACDHIRVVAFTEALARAGCFLRVRAVLLSQDPTHG